MKKVLLSLFGMVLLSTVAVAQNFEWNTGATSGGHIWYGSSISQIGNTVITGSYGSYMNIDTVSRTGTSYYISMVDSTGGVKYFRNSNKGISILASDNNSNTYIGINESSIAFDNDTIKSDTINEKIVLVKFNSQMGMLWKKQIKPVNPSANLSMGCNSISTDISGNVYALFSGTNYGNVRMDTAHFNCYGNVLVKFDANGTIQFLRNLGFTSSISVMSIDHLGNIWISGKYGYNSYASSQQIDFGNNVIITNTTASSNGNSIPYVACFNSSGVTQSASFVGYWQSQFTATATPKGISFDSYNNAVMYNTNDFYKFSANGAYQWTKNASDIYKIKFGSDDRMYFMTSYTAGSGATIGDTTFARASFTTSSSDRALFCFDTAFKCVWVRFFKKAEANNVVPSLEVIANGDIYFTSCEFSPNSLYFGKLGSVVVPGYGTFAAFVQDSLSIGHLGGAPYILKLSPNGLPSLLAAPTQLAITPLMLERTSGYMDLSWTDNANNEIGFQIQRSPDGTAWTAIDSVPANVTAYTDNTTLPVSIYYYRVAAFNSTGLSGYSNIVSAATLTTSVDYSSASINTLMISPNPSSGKFQLSIAKFITKSIQLKVTDILGKQVYTEMLPTGINYHSIDLSQLPNGIYLLHGNNLSVQKLIIQK